MKNAPTEAGACVQNNLVGRQSGRNDSIVSSAIGRVSIRVKASSIGEGESGGGHRQKLCSQFTAAKVDAVDIHIEQSVLKISHLGRINRERLLRDCARGRRRNATEREEHRSVRASASRPVNMGGNGR